MSNQKRTITKYQPETSLEKFVLSSDYYATDQYVQVEYTIKQNIEDLSYDNGLKPCLYQIEFLITDLSALRKSDNQLLLDLRDKQAIRCKINIIDSYDFEDLDTLEDLIMIKITDENFSLKEVQVESTLDNKTYKSIISNLDRDIETFTSDEILNIVKSDLNDEMSRYIKALEDSSVNSARFQLELQSRKFESSYQDYVKAHIPATLDFDETYQEIRQDTKGVEILLRLTSHSCRTFVMPEIIARFNALGYQISMSDLKFYINVSNSHMSIELESDIEDVRKSHPDYENLEVQKQTFYRLVLPKVIRQLDEKGKPSRIRSTTFPKLMQLVN